VTKHALGIYSTTPVKGTWRREDPKTYQRDIDAMAHPEVDPKPDGEGTIETYTVMHDRAGPKIGIVIGRLGNGKRFLAHTPDDPATLNDLMEREALGRRGRVTPGEKINRFVPQ
jgi:acetyl-CoA C-acetyltransferase